MAEAKTYDEWVRKYSSISSEKSRLAMTGKTGKWFVQNFSGWEDLFRQINGTAHAQAYLQGNTDREVSIKFPFKFPAHKIKADHLMGLERDIRMAGRNRLGFFRVGITKEEISRRRMDLVQIGLDSLSRTEYAVSGTGAA